MMTLLAGAFLALGALGGACSKAGPTGAGAASGSGGEAQGTGGAADQGCQACVQLVTCCADPATQKLGSGVTQPCEGNTPASNLMACQDTLGTGQSGSPGKPQDNLTCERDLGELAIAGRGSVPACGPLPTACPNCAKLVACCDALVAAGLAPMGSGNYAYCVTNHNAVNAWQGCLTTMDATVVSTDPQDDAACAMDLMYQLHGTAGIAACGGGTTTSSSSSGASSSSSASSSSGSSSGSTCSMAGAPGVACTAACDCDQAKCPQPSSMQTECVDWGLGQGNVCACTCTASTMCNSKCCATVPGETVMGCAPASLCP